MDETKEHRALGELMKKNLDLSYAAAYYIEAVSAHFCRPKKVISQEMNAAKTDLECFLAGDVMFAMTTDELNGKLAIFKAHAENLAAEAKQYRRLERILSFIFGNSTNTIGSDAKDQAGADDGLLISLTFSMATVGLWMARGI